METTIQKIYRPFVGPTYFPAIFSQDLSNWINELEKLFKQPIKNAFPYPMDIVKIYTPGESPKLQCLRFDIALAGISKECIKVQLKNKKFLTIFIEKPQVAQDSLNQQTVCSEYVNKGISYRNADITFKIFHDVDLEKFKPIFKNGLLTIDLYVKDVDKEADIIDAEIS